MKSKEEVPKDLPEAHQIKSFQDVLKLYHMKGEI
jgi:hypothetical protein